MNVFDSLRLREERLRLGLSIPEASQAAGIDPARLEQLESGSDEPFLDEVVSLAGSYQVELRTFLGSESSNGSDDNDTEQGGKLWKLAAVLLALAALTAATFLLMDRPWVSRDLTTRPNFKDSLLIGSDHTERECYLTIALGTGFKLTRDAVLRFKDAGHHQAIERVRAALASDAQWSATDRATVKRWKSEQFEAWMEEGDLDADRVGELTEMLEVCIRLLKAWEDDDSRVGVQVRAMFRMLWDAVDRN